MNGIHEVRGSIPLASTRRPIREGRWSGCIVAGIAQLVEHNLAKVGVAGSSPVSRSGVALRAAQELAVRAQG